MKITSILHPTDFSDSSLNAFRIATDLAKAYNARLLALHVYDSAIPPVGIAGTVPLSAPARVQREALDAQLRQSLDR